MSHLETQIDGSVGVITINRQECLNAMTAEMFEQLVEITRAFAADDQVRAVVVTGRGKAFCSGGDVRDLGSVLNAKLNDQAADYIRSLMESARLLAEMPKPTIAAIRGAAAGAGMSLALACDFRIVAVGSVMTTAFSRMGVSGDFGISYFLTHLVGAARARELLMCSPRISAESAFDLGLAHNLVPVDLLEEETMSFARKLADGPTRAFGLMKSNINQVTSNVDLPTCFSSEAKNMVESLSSRDHQEAAKAFLQKREPQFKGR